MSTRLYIDTNIFIAAFETTGDPRDHAWRVLDAAERGIIEVVTSELTLAELLSKPPQGVDAVASRYEAMLTTRPGLAVVPIGRAVLLAAAAIRRSTAQTRLPDAIHLATATESGCSHLLTSDLRLRSTALPIIRLGPGSVEQAGGSTL